MDPQAESLREGQSTLSGSGLLAGSGLPPEPQGSAGPGTARSQVGCGMDSAWQAACSSGSPGEGEQAPVRLPPLLLPLPSHLILGVRVEEVLACVPFLHLHFSLPGELAVGIWRSP